jgi:O-antigen/teichoic acid export membrane protein
MSAVNLPSALASDRHMASMIGKNTIFGMVANGVQVGTRFIMVPLVIHHLGLGGYGIWAIIMATAGYMRFGSAGLKSAFQKYVAESTGTGDFETANKLLSTGSLSMLVLSVAGLVPIAIYSRNLAVASGVPAEFLSAAAGAITLLALTMVMANFGAAFEATLMGSQRIDLTRTFNITTTLLEAIAIIALLHFGHGLFAMAVVMATSELAYISCCFVASRRIAPQIQIRISHFTSSVSRELIWYAGSYQLVNVLEVLYAMLLPVVMLKFFGAEIAGVYALATRLVTAVLMGQDALILPLLSGGAVIFATGSKERLIRFFKKSFKLTIAITLLPLAFVGVFGALLVYVWTGQTGSHFSAAIWLLCLGGFFNSISRLQLILYRASGNALHDNIRQAFRLGVLGILSIFGNSMGFNGVLLGLAVAELVGVVYMFIAMTSTLSFFTPRLFVRDTVRLVTATFGIVLVGLAVLMIPAPLSVNEHTMALIKLGEVSLACLLFSFPAIALTKSISVEEQRAVLSLLTPWRRNAPLADQ